MSSSRVVVTADDFGYSPAVNEAVEIAHREGVLDAASLMVGGAAAAAAVARSRTLPRLRVGLHVVAADGPPVSAPSAIPALVDRRGMLDGRLVWASIRMFVLPAARRQMRAEVRAQFEAFRASGLRLDHVDAHRHMHLHPTVLGAIIDAARGADAPVVRVPREPLRAAGGTPRGRQLAAAVRAAFLAPWLALMRWRLRRAGIPYRPYVLGLGDTGAMTEDTVLRLIARLPRGDTEIYCHPATASPSTVPLPMAVESHLAELRALCSVRVRTALETARSS